MARMNSTVTKRTISIRIRGDLLSAACEAGVDLSSTLERALTEQLVATKRKTWLAENHEAIKTYNEHVARHGTFAEKGRAF